MIPLKVAVDFLLSKMHTLCISKKQNVFVGDGTVIYRKAKVDCQMARLGGVKIGRSCRIGCSSQRYHAGMPFYTKLLCDTENASIEIGDSCRLNGAYVHAKKNIKIGDNCVIASGVNIIDSNGHQTASLDRTIGRDNPQAIIIGNNVWIGLNSIILKGSVIGDNSIISAGSVVRGNVPPNVVYSTNSEVCIKEIIYNYE